MLTEHSANHVGTRRASQGRAGLHHRARARTQEHCREHQCAHQVVEHLPAHGTGWPGFLPSVVAETFL